ncbi:MAG: cellulase family glycosylhydrolase [Saccharolobus sp.]|uniref:DUF4434 domain-containing protein n=1 Tax=Saccharolobus sp. TaxID=2100761 RepID=UPI0028CD5ECD|nr:DUF4434 domain-containing protein [Saccharolobus sp.]MDT7862208.1 cellulase family glycosylhydrolase [Saccharolobus sp.]
MKRFLIGVNYWPRISNIKMWSKFNLNEIENDLKLMRDLGINAIRAFILDEDCSDEKGNFTEECKQKLYKFLNITEKYSVKVLLTFIVGHMSGKNWKIPWDKDSSIYDKIEPTRKFITAIIKEFKDHGSILGWILTNEISLVRLPQNEEIFLRWLKELYKTVKEIDNTHVVSVGDNVSPFSHTFLKPENVRGIVDYASPHIYLYDQNPIRHSMQYFMILEYNRSSGLPVILEEFGFPTAVYSEESHARFIGLILRGALLYGAEGALIWCFSDFPREDDEPYMWEPHELTFGIVRKDGTIKPAAEVVKDFSNKVKEIDISKYKVAKREAAIIIPAWFYKNFQFVNEQSKRLDFAKVLSQSFTLARLSNIQITFVREEDSNIEDYKLIIIPSTTRLLTTTWRKLLRAVENGSVLYFSTYSLTHLSATHLWEEVFGVIPNSPAGSKGVRIPEKIRLLGEEVEIGKMDLYTYSFVEKDAKVIGEDSLGKGFVFISNRGKGYSVLSTIPIEFTLTNNENINESWIKFYNYLSKISNTKQRYPSEKLGVEIQYLEGEDDYLLGVINHSWEDVTMKIKDIMIKEEIDQCIKDDEIIVKAKSACLMYVKK